MNLQTKVVGVIAASTALMLVLAPLLITNASARITETTSCTNHGGHVSDGACNGNTDSNKKTESCVAKNPAGHAPPGQNPC
jgi:hypothetical protein